MPTFEVKQINVPLFGVVEAQNQGAWLTAFSATTATIQVQVDAAALDIIADDLELDAEGLAADAERYVNGSYRAKARGLGGSRLGDLGEILTFLMNRAVGHEIVRVVSWRAGSGQAIKGASFPQPDFIIKDETGLSALEVKSTEAFDFVDLRDTAKKWIWLQPCISVGGCRERALRQLAFVGGKLTPQKHSLVMRYGAVVPFPVGKGVATAVLAVDGRANVLRSEQKYKTPKTCRQVSRDCWSCLPMNCNFVLVKMPNAPGALSLGGAASDGSTKWLRAYQRWSQALAAHDLLAVRASLDALIEQVVSWLDAADQANADVLRGFWGSYLHDAMRSRGLDVEVPGQLRNLSRPELGFEWTRAPLAEPSNREGSVEDIARLVSQDQDSAAPFMMSARLWRNDLDADSVTIRVLDDYVEFHLVSETWWAQGAVETIDNASLIATRLLSIALEASGWTVPMEGDGVPLREVVVQVGEHKVRLGWESKSATQRSGSWRSWMRRWPFWFDFDLLLPWPALLVIGDPRVRLRVMPDGRANLRLLRTLLRHR